MTSCVLARLHTSRRFMRSGLYYRSDASSQLENPYKENPYNEKLCYNLRKSELLCKITTIVVDNLETTVINDVNCRTCKFTSLQIKLTSSVVMKQIVQVNMYTYKTTL